MGCREENWSFLHWQRINCVSCLLVDGEFNSNIDREITQNAQRRLMEIFHFNFHFKFDFYYSKMDYLLTKYLT